MPSFELYLSPRTGFSKDITMTYYDEMVSIIRECGHRFKLVSEIPELDGLIPKVDFLEKANALVQPHAKFPDLDCWVRFEFLLSSHAEQKIIDTLHSKDYRVAVWLVNHFKYSLEESIKQFFTAASIARPGDFEYSEAYCFYDQKFEGSLEGHFSTFTGGSAQFQAWPAVQKLNLRDTIDWAYQLPTFLNGVSRTPLQRALNSFTYLFKEAFYDDEVDLIWSLRGLEALFTTGSTANLNSKQAQLVEKSILLLGSPPQNTTFEKMIKEMYDYRSRFLHGDLNIPSKVYRRRDEYWDSHGDKLLRQHELVEFASQMLLVTLQICAAKKVRELDFTLQLDMRH